MVRSLLLMGVVASLTLGCGEVRSATDASQAPDAIRFDGGSQIADAGEQFDADPCAGVTCECVNDGECGSHEVCNTSGPGRVCECAPRYEDQGSGCVWAGAPDDPSFQDGAVWAATGNALVLPTATGSVAPGQVLLSPAAVCELAVVSQTVTMPTYAQAEPLAIEVTHRSQGGGSKFALGGGGGGVEPAIALNGRWFQLDFYSAWQTQKLCLGDAAYGGDVNFAVSAAFKPGDCTFGPSSIIDVDHMEVVADATCPAPGEVVNGDFEGSGDWTTTNNATIATGLGVGGSAAMRLSTATLCSSAITQGTASLPSQGVTAPALQFWSRGTVDRKLNISISNVSLTSLVATGTATTTKVCLLPGMLGWVRDLSFSLPFTGGSCATADVREFLVDNVTTVNEPTCGTDPYIVDGTFETAAAGTVVTPWSLTVSANRGTAAIISDASVAQNGLGVLEFSLKQECSSGSASTYVRVPAADGVNGPAVQFSYKAPTNVETSLYATPGSGALTEGGGWTTQTTCLDPALAGRMERVQFTLTTNGGTCANTFTPEFAWVDDVKVITSAACPLP